MVPTSSRFVILAISLIGAIVAGTLFGDVPVSHSEALGIILSRIGFPTGHSWPVADVTIIWTLRLPEVLTAVIVGVALSTAGVLFQAVLRNPLADPFVMGTSSGAALGATTAIIGGMSFAWHGFGAVQVLAFVGAIGAVVVVYALSRVHGRTPVTTLLLSGFAVSTLLVAGMWLEIFVGGRTDQVVRWTMGDLTSTAWDQLALLAPLVAAGFVLSGFFVRDLNAMLLGEEQAAYLGIDVERAKVILVTVGALLTALAVSASGIIGFVGLVIPHIGRLVYGSNHRLLLPAGALLGGTFLALADLASRTLAAPNIVPLGVLTAVLGAPFFLYLLRQARFDYRF